MYLIISHEDIQASSSNTDTFTAATTRRQDPIFNFNFLAGLQYQGNSLLRRSERWLFQKKKRNNKKNNRYVVDDKKRENAEGPLPSILGDPVGSEEKSGGTFSEDVFLPFPSRSSLSLFFPSTQPPCDT